MTDFAAVAVDTVTVEPASAPVATLVQARPAMLTPSRDCSGVQAAPGPVGAAFVFQVRSSTRLSPGCTLLGTCTRWLVRLPAELVVATWLSSASPNVPAVTE